MTNQNTQQAAAQATIDQQNAAAAQAAQQAAAQAGGTNNPQAVMNAMGLNQEQQQAVMANQAAGVKPIPLYNFGGQLYTEQQLNAMGYCVSNVQPTAHAEQKSGLFDGIPDWLITAAKVALGIIAVVGLVLVVKNFVVPKFFGDRTVEYNGAEIDDIEV